MDTEKISSEADKFVISILNFLFDRDINIGRSAKVDLKLLLIKLLEESVKTISEEGYDKIPNKEFLFGKAVKAEETVGYIMGWAKEQFAQGNDQAANMLRTLSNNMRLQAKELRSYIDKEYPDKPI